MTGFAGGSLYSTWNKSTFCIYIIFNHIHIRLKDKELNHQKMRELCNNWE
jgi:hypothetical protein